MTENISNKKIRYYLLLVLVGLFSNHLIKAQSLEFPTENAVWNFSCSAYPIDPNFGFGRQSLNGDSIYNGTNYQKIDNSGTWLIGDDSGLIRSEDNKVFFIPTDSLEEFLLYDFNLELGDTFYVNAYHKHFQDEFIILNQMDSIMTADGLYRKRFYMGECIWIEGVGSITGSLTQPWYFGSVSGDCGLLCFSKDSNYIIESTFTRYDGYESFEYDCNGSLLVSLDEVEVESKLKIFPNPFFEELFVETEGNQTISSLLLFDTSFRIITSSQNSNRIDLKSKKISAGLYILQVTIGDSKFFKKVLKK